MRHGSRRRLVIWVVSMLALLWVGSGGRSTAGSAATDPGPRGGPPGAGGPLPGLGQTELKLFTAGQATIQEIDSVQGTVPGTGLGLGPRFNMDSCGGCHNYPAPGGSSPPVNPQVAVATKENATNVVPFFVTIDGPIRHAFVKSNPETGSHGGTQTHLYTITGRTDAPGCVLEQPDFDALAAANDLVLHIPLPLYGAGLIEAIDPATIVANLASNRTAKRALGIAGHPGAGRGLGRFLWKGQAVGLTVIAAGAYADEVGVTNALVRVENDQTPGCQFNPVPEDTFDPSAPTPIEGLPDFAKIAGFARLSAPPMPIPDTPSIANGRSLFVQIGCSLCHTPSLPTGMNSRMPGRTAQLYSDLALHRMGPNLADGLAVGNAGPDEFRTAPLWGLGQRIFFLHDGRTSNLLDAISAHASQADSTFRPSEANGVIAAFDALSDQQQQDILNFLRAL